MKRTKRAETYSDRVASEFERFVIREVGVGDGEGANLFYQVCNNFSEIRCGIKRKRQRRQAFFQQRALKDEIKTGPYDSPKQKARSTTANIQVTGSARKKRIAALPSKYDEEGLLFVDESKLNCNEAQVKTESKSSFQQDLEPGEGEGSKSARRHVLAETPLFPENEKSKLVANDAIFQMLWPQIPEYELNKMAVQGIVYSTPPPLSPSGALCQCVGCHTLEPGKCGWAYQLSRTLVRRSVSDSKSLENKRVKITHDALIMIDSTFLGPHRDHNVCNLSFEKAMMVRQLFEHQISKQVYSVMAKYVLSTRVQSAAVVRQEMGERLVANGVLLPVKADAIQSTAAVFEFLKAAELDFGRQSKRDSLTVLRNALSRFLPDVEAGKIDPITWHELWDPEASKFEKIALAKIGKDLHIYTVWGLFKGRCIQSGPGAIAVPDDKYDYLKDMTNFNNAFKTGVKKRVRRIHGL